MAKQPTKVASAQGIVGLLAADSMPIRFAGREYDLANLTADEEAYLRQFPEAVPYFDQPLAVSYPASV